jgi:hypothetical protein
VLLLRPAMARTSPVLELPCTRAEGEYLRSGRRLFLVERLDVWRVQRGRLPVGAEILLREWYSLATVRAQVLWSEVVAFSNIGEGPSRGQCSIWTSARSRLSPSGWPRGSR